MTHFQCGLPNVELHHHLDGSVRLSTVMDVAEKRKIPFDDAKFKSDLQREMNLEVFLKLFDQFLPVIQGDVEAVERIAYESVEDHYNNGVAYFETRFSPQLLLEHNGSRDWDCQSSACVHDIIEAVFDGLERGEEDFGVIGRVIVCGIRGQSPWLIQLKKLIKTYRYSPWIVGVDIAGNENLPWSGEELQLAKEFYEEAKRLGLGRTIHAGEQGMFEHVRQAIEIFDVERVGHGYAVFEDPSLLELCQKNNIHFEFCPISANTLGSLIVPFDSPKNPIRLASQCDLNFSLNCDDALFFGNLRASVKKCVTELGFTTSLLQKINVNASKAAFLPSNQKAALLRHVERESHDVESHK
jgi:adenosine deaminase